MRNEINRDDTQEFAKRHSATQPRGRRRMVMLGILVLAFGWSWMTSACIGEIGSLASGSGAPDSSTPPANCPVPSIAPHAEPSTCPAPVEDPCWRYRIQLVGDLMKADLRAKYVLAFGDACYVSEANTFDCWYKTWQKACEDAVLIGEKSGNAAYDKGYTCQAVGNGNYTLQIGPDKANITTIFLDKALRQTPQVEVDGMLVDVNGPYRNLPEPPTVGIGQPFNKCFSGMVDENGEAIYQKDYILQINRNAHGGEIHSDLAGYKWPCYTTDENCNVVKTECEEPLVLADPDAKPPPFHPGSIARVHHIVPMTDKRGCAWGTNSNNNAAVISEALNIHFRNHNPPADEVKRLNNAPTYTP